MSKIFKVIQPESYLNAEYSDNEYLLQWLGRDGSINHFMFYDAILDTQIKSSIINEIDSENISAIVSSITNGLKISVTNLTKNEFLALSQIKENRFITRIKIDGTTERYAPDASSFKYRQSDKRYSLDFSLSYVNTAVWK